MIPCPLLLSCLVAVHKMDSVLRLPPPMRECSCTPPACCEPTITTAVELLGKRAATFAHLTRQAGLADLLQNTTHSVTVLDLSIHAIQRRLMDVELRYLNHPCGRDDVSSLIAN